MAAVPVSFKMAQLTRHFIKRSKVEDLPPIWSTEWTRELHRQKWELQSCRMG